MTDLERIKKDVVEMDSRANVCWYDTKVLTKAVRLILEELTADRKTEPQRDCFLCKWLGEVDVCGRCRNRNLFAEADTEPKPKTEPTSSKMEQVDKDINVRSKDKPTTQTKTQKSNLTFKTLEYCDICDHKGCEECIANALDEHCMPSQFNKQIEDECAKEYEELGLKELKELIEADRKTESNSEKPNNCEYAENPSGDVWECGCFLDTYCEHQIYDRNPDGTINIVECGYEPKDEPQTDCGTCKHHYGKDHYDIDCERLAFGSECRYEPQTEEGASCRQARAKKFGEMDDATFKAHCMNCQRDPADIKCLDCDGNKYFLSYGAQTDCAWK